MVPAAGGGEPVEAAFAGRAAALEAVFLLVCAWLAAVEACWLAGLPAGGAADGFAPGAAVGCPAGTPDPAGLRTGEVGQVGPPTGARHVWHTGQPRK